MTATTGHPPGRNDPATAGRAASTNSVVSRKMSRPPALRVPRLRPRRHLRPERRACGNGPPTPTKTAEPPALEEVGDQHARLPAHEHAA